MDLVVAARPSKQGFAKVKLLMAPKGLNFSKPCPRFYLIFILIAISCNNFVSLDELSTRV